MQSPPSLLKNNKEALEKVRRERELYIKVDLAKKFRASCMGFLFGWKDSSLQTDIALGVDRRKCLLEALSEVVEYIEKNYSGDKKNE